MINNYLICRYCGSKKIKVVGGINGNPFDRRQETYICCECGRCIQFDVSDKQNIKKIGTGGFV